MSGRYRHLSEANPWGGATLEWTLPSPPEFENWEHHPPVITHGPYVFNGHEMPKEGKSTGEAAPVPGAEKKGR